MRKATLTRNETGDAGTFGTLVTDSGFTCRTGELPWRDNATGTSCIPPGTYICQWLPSPKHGMCYHVEDVPGRWDVEIHAANWMGDETLGYFSQLRGCLAPGHDVKWMATPRGVAQLGVSQSQDALEKLIADLWMQPFELTVVGTVGD